MEKVNRIIALVTGGSRGIGRAVCVCFVALLHQRFARASVLFGNQSLCAKRRFMSLDTCQIPSLTVCRPYCDDERICQVYYLTANNYMAYDKLYGCHDYESSNMLEQKAKFFDHMRALNKYEESNINILKEIFLGIYEKPIAQSPKPHT